MYILQEEELNKNLQLIKRVETESGVKIILAFKAFAQWKLFPLINKSISTATASSLWEAKLCAEEYGNKAHTYSPAYLPNQMAEILTYSSHITFNSLDQLRRYTRQSQEANVSIGLRVNPHYSDVTTELYNPAASSSRLGVSIDTIKNQMPAVDGMHFHTLCESDANATCQLIDTIESKIGDHFGALKWLNFGGGHLITKKGYDIELLIRRIKKLKSDYPHLTIYLEPGSAVLWETGYLTSSVLDIVESDGIKTAILDISFTCHMPDTLEMPYRPNIKEGSADAQTHNHQYRLGGVSCLAGDYLERYSFPYRLRVGDTLTFLDMMHYTLVKSTMFNGVKHPSIGLEKMNGEIELIKEYTYQDYRDRMC